MTIGRPITREDIDSTAAGIATNLYHALDDVLKFKAVLDGLSTEDDLMGRFGYTQEDVDRLRSAFVDMAEVTAYWKGDESAGPTRDHRWSAKWLLGTGLY